MSTFEVTIVTYPGHETYLKQTIDSFLAQGIEPIVVNDKRPQHEKWNELIDNCKTDYIFLAHHDDVYGPTFCKEMIDYMDSHLDVAACFCLDYIIDQNGNVIGETRPTWPLKDKYYFEDVFEKLTHQIQMIRCPSVVLRLSLLDGARWEDKSVYGGAHDTQFWFKILNNHPIGIIPKPLYKYRIHNDSDTQKNVVAVGANIGMWKAFEYGASLRPFDVHFSSHIHIAKNMKLAESLLDHRRVMDRSAGCEFLVVHEPPEAFGTGIVVADRCRRLNKLDDNVLRYYVYPSNNDRYSQSVVLWDKGCPVICCPSEGLGDLANHFKPSKIEFHHLLSWPLHILDIEAKRKELFLHDSFLWCAAHHSFDKEKSVVCNEPEPIKCLQCAGISLSWYETKRSYLLKNLPLLDRIVANSEYTAKYCKINLGVEAEVEVPTGGELIPIKKRAVVGYFGGYQKVKGVQYLLQIWKLIDAQLLMFCEMNPDWLDGKKLIGYDNVLVMGPYKRDDLSQIVNLIDFAVVPSVNESYGLIARELRSLGIKVIATKTGGLDGTVPPSDSRALLAELEKEIYSAK